MPKGQAASQGHAEKAALAGEIDEIEGALGRLRKVMATSKGDGRGGGPGSSETTRAWEMFRSLSLKLNRVASRSEDLAAFVKAAASEVLAFSKGGKEKEKRKSAK